MGCSSSRRAHGTKARGAHSSFSYRSKHCAGVRPTMGAMVRHWVGMSLARCSSFSSSSRVHSVFLMLGSSHSYHRALHCLADFRTSRDEMRAHWFSPYFITAALRISSCTAPRPGVTALHLCLENKKDKLYSPPFQTRRPHQPLTPAPFRHAVDHRSPRPAWAGRTSVFFHTPPLIMILILRLAFAAGAGAAAARPPPPAGAAPALRRRSRRSWRRRLAGDRGARTPEQWRTQRAEH